MTDGWIRSPSKKPQTLGLELFTWLGWRDSNPRMPGPKPGALPLGDIPLVPTHCSTGEEEIQKGRVRYNNTND